MTLNSSELVEHYFRHEYGRLVSLLVCRVGVGRLADVEDAVQEALLTGLRQWPQGGVPDNPSAWLYRVARNRLLDILRIETHRNHLLEVNREEAAPVPVDTALPAEFESFGDELLRMLFVCADTSIPTTSQLVLALKTLCGFHVREIAPRLFLKEDTVYKRLQRARQQLRANPPDLNALSDTDLAERLPTVRQMLYLLFTEGHLSLRADAAIRKELCHEALRLAELLGAHPIGNTPETCALLALFHLTTARLEARGSANGGVLLLEEQDRSRWDRTHIDRGLRWLNRSAHGEVFSRFHAEAAIAAEHAIAPSFAQTRWNRIVETYAQLEKLNPSPLHTLNRALAVAEWKGPAEGLEIVRNLEPPPWLRDSHLWAAVQADLHRRCGHESDARHFTNLALNAAPNDAIRRQLQRRLSPERNGATA